VLRHALVTLYPWDVLDGHIGELLDRLHGEIGVTGVSLWTGCPPTVHLRSRDMQPRLIRSAGGLFFRPTPRFYDDASCFQAVAATDATRERDPLRILSEACAVRRMELRAKVSCSLSGGITARHPMAATVNAFDDASSGSVCLANPEIQRFLCALATDLSSAAGLSALELIDSVIAWHEAAAGVRAAVPLGEAERILLGTCFCEACRVKTTAAGVDFAAAKRACRTLLNTALEDPLAKGPRIAGLLAESVALRSLFEWRSSELASFLRHLAAASHCEVILDRSFDPIELRQHNAAVLATPAAVLSRLDRVAQLDSIVSPGVRRYELRVPAALAIGANGAELVSALSQAAVRGVSGVQFDTYGLLPESALTVVRQAIRYARRANQA